MPYELLADGFIIVSRLAHPDLDHGWMLRTRGLASIALGVLIGLWSSATAPALVAIIATWTILARVFKTGAVNVAAGKLQAVWSNLTEHKMVRAR